jgi:2-methylisocitrate lyase-like PEP mutase family enzyme
MAVDQASKGRAFRALHERPRAFVLPNPWDVGSAVMLAHLGFEALATTSAGYAWSIGCLDGEVGRDRMLAHAAHVAAATDLPVSGDLENGFGDAPEDVAETIRLAAHAGLVGGSIEDGTGRPDAPVYDRSLAIERVHAAAEAARRLPFPFTLTARAENFIVGRPDLDDTVDRLQAFERAGADVLYAPGVKSLDEIRAVLGAVSRPINVLAGIQGFPHTLADLDRMGVRRVSVGGALARAAYGALLGAAADMRELGSFAFVDRSPRSVELASSLRGRA